MNFETGGFPEIQLVGYFFSSLYLLIFGMVSLLDLLVSDFHLSPVKLAVFRLFDKMLSLDTRAALKEDTCDLWQKHAAVRQVLDSNGEAFIFMPKTSHEGKK